MSYRVSQLLIRSCLNLLFLTCLLFMSCSDRRISIIDTIQTRSVNMNCHVFIVGFKKIYYIYLFACSLIGQNQLHDIIFFVICVIYYSDT